MSEEQVVTYELEGEIALVLRSLVAPLYLIASVGLSYLAALGLSSLEELVDKTVPLAIRLNRPLDLPGPRGEMEVLAELRELAGKNKVVKSFIGQGYYDTFTPPVITTSSLRPSTRSPPSADSSP